MKQFRLPILSTIRVLFLFFCMTYISCIILDYKTLKVKMCQLVQFHKENEQQNKQFLYPAEQVDQITEKRGNLKENHRKLNEEVNIRAKDDNNQLLSVGGSDSSIWESYYSMDKTQWDPGWMVHNSLDNINGIINAEKYTEMEKASFSRNKKGHNIGETDKIREQLKAIAVELGLEPRLALSMGRVESGYNPKAVSPKGAIGVLQIMPQFACRDSKIKQEMLFDPQINIRVGLSHMKYLLNRFNEDLDLSLAAYNAGVSRIVRAGYRIPPIEETQVYVRRVKEAMKNEI